MTRQPSAWPVRSTDFNLKYRLTFGQITKIQLTVGHSTKLRTYLYKYEVLVQGRVTDQALVHI
jgi:hypothetical protein